MAIKKTNLFRYGSLDDTLDNLYNYLLENAVPKYFDSVEKNDTGTYIVCTVNGRDFVKFPKTFSSYPTVKFSNGSEYYLSASSAAYYGWAVKTKRGICLGTYSSSGYANPVFTICKDNENNTTLVFNANDFSNTMGSDYSVMAVNENTVDSSFPVVKALNSDLLKNVSEKTVLCPFMVGGTENYTPDVFYMGYAQNRSGGRIRIDGAAYYSNGIWAVRDE